MELIIRDTDITPRPPGRSRLDELVEAGPVDLKNLSPKELTAFVGERGLPAYRAKQLIQWLYQKGVSSFDEMTNLSRELRQRLSEEAYISRMTPHSILLSGDGSRKFLFKLRDEHEIESVLIPEERRLTLCISTQVGCPLACGFCVTGVGGVKRNLSASEIIGQIQAVIERLGEGERLTNIVVMGMGEPLLNYENLVSALEIALMEQGFGFSHRRITVSTSGIVPNIARLGVDLPVNLAVSLNATTEEQRRKIMPITRRWSLAELLEACRRYPCPGNKPITFEYVMLAGFNTSPEDADRINRLLRGIRAKVNLIPYNENPWMSFRRPSFEEVKVFQDRLLQRGMYVTVRWSRGEDIGAACGQLGGSRAEEKAGPPPRMPWRTDAAEVEGG